MITIYLGLLMFLGACISNVHSKVYIPSYPFPSCKGGVWTGFFDRDDPGATGDWETLKDLRKKYSICLRPSVIDVRLLDGRHWKTGGDFIVPHQISPSYGFVCINKNQKYGRRCKNYKVRFCCPTPPPPACTYPYKWTSFYDRDDPSVTGDYETLHDLRKKNPGKICSKPKYVDARLVHGKGHYLLGGDHVTISPTHGLTCKKALQPDGKCNDYEVRFCCKPECYYTKFFDRDNPSGTGDWEDLNNLRKENKGQICPHPVKIEAYTVLGHTKAEETGQRFKYYDVHKGFVCLNKEQKVYNPMCFDYKVRFLCC